LAALAGISVDYLVRLEQGRAGRPSVQVIAALARALQLDRQERDHLYRLGGLQPPQDGLISDHIPPGLQRLLVRLGETPVGVFTADWRLIWWNDSWSALFGDPSGLPAEDRSYLRTRFPVPGEHDGGLSLWPVVSTDPDGTDRAMVADLRRAAGRHPADPRLASVLQRTLDGNPDFARLWREGAVAGHREERKTIQHPQAGDITVDCDVLTDSDTDLKIVAYTTTPGSEDETRLQFTRVISTQNMQYDRRPHPTTL
jgi:transcriptional regulator with XRE-family HTH domain